MRAMTLNLEPDSAPRTPRWKQFGRRNIAYIAFVVLLIPFGIALEASGPGGPDRGGGVGAALMIWGVGSLAFFVVNAVLLVFALVRSQPVAKAFVACALPVGLIVVSMMLAGMMEF
jgi:hypothetical protein